MSDNKRLVPICIIFIIAVAGTVFGESALSQDRRITMSDIPAELLAELQNEWERGVYRWAPDDHDALIFLFDDALPELQYELPQVLIGQFVLVSHASSLTLFIFPNNKYILLEEKGLHPNEIIYGYIIKKNDEWWFSDEPLSSLGLRGFGKIQLEESGFSFSGLRAMRKEDMPVPEHLAQGISVTPWREAKQEYFTFGNQGDDTVDFYEIDGFRDSSYRFFHLRIDNGIVRILCVLSPGEWGIYFDGFIDIVEESPDFLKGIIRFTNGTPYYYVDSGTAEIVINSNGNITITMLYTPDLTQQRKRPIFDEFKFPAKLTLEF